MPSGVVLITGANNGSGLGLTKALAQNGYRIAALDLSGENLAGLRFHQRDVTDQYDCAANKGDFVIHLGYPPWYHPGAAVKTPSGRA